MKKIKIVLIMMILTGLCSCRKDLLNQSNPNFLTDDQVMSNNAAVTAFIAGLYVDMPMEDFSFVHGQFWTFSDGGPRYLSNYSDEALDSQDGTNAVESSNFPLIYQGIRNVNRFLELIQTNAPNINAVDKAAFIAEAKFIRAYEYFGLVKYWGGVPLLLTTQGQNPVPLPAAKEVEVWDQVKKDLEEAAAGLPADKTKLGYGRANKWAALALEARAMLHAGTIGVYAEPSINGGLNGVDAAHRDVYLNAAYTAAKAIMDGGAYQLYQKYAAPGLATPTTEADYAKNFQYLFYDTKQGDSNTEAIFNRGYDFATSGNRTHSQDLTVLPEAIKSATGYGNASQASLDFAEKWEYLDGSAGTFGKYAVGVGGTPAPAPGQIQVQYHYPKQTTPFEHKDPRFHGTLISNGTAFRNSPPQGITSQRGVIMGNTIYPGSNYNQYFDADPASKSYKTFNGDPSKFNDGKGSAKAVLGTGNSNRDNKPFWLKKWTDPVTDISLIKDYTSRTSWMDLRLGEVILDYAEAAYELKKPDAEAIGAVNQLRARAGIFPLSAALTGVPLRDAIRHERMVELAFENKIYWDYVRWRAFGTDFSGRPRFGLECYWDIDTNDYVYIKTQPGTRTKNIQGYYTDFQSSDISSDPLLRPSGHNPYY